jgi:hypothetical protein
MLVQLRESQLSEVVDLTVEQAEALRGETERFRVQVKSDEVEEAKTDRPALELVCVEAGRYQIRAGNFVGVVVAGDITVIIRPKINFQHFAYIAAHSFGVPSSGVQSVRLDDENAFQVLIARWFLESARRIIPNLLISDYMEVRERVPTKRGRVHYIPTYRMWLRAQFELDVTHEEFELDHPLNRILRKGLQMVSGMRQLSQSDRQLTLRLLGAMPAVGEMSPADLAAGIDRRSHHYETPIQLARCLIAGRGRALEAGGRKSQTFLVETPSLIESGLRNILSDQIRECERRPRCAIVDPLGPARPDLVFRSTTQTRVGDIKYKLFDGWGDMRADLYQSVFFAAAYETYQSVILGFTADRSQPLDEVRVGRHEVRAVLWNASEEVDPRDAAAEIIEQFGAWLAPEVNVVSAARSAGETSLVGGSS